MRYLVCLLALLANCGAISAQEDRYSNEARTVFALADESAYDFCEANADSVMLYYRYVEEDYCELVAGPGKYAGVIDIPAHVTEKSIPVVGVGFKAFYYCDELTEVHVPNTVLYLEAGSFYSNYHLTTVTLGKGLKTIGQDAFSQNNKLTTIDIPSSVETIEMFAFGYCTGLKDVIVHWDTPLPMVFDAFDSYQFYLGMTLHVPAGTQELYANAPCWSQFTTIQADADNLHHPTADSFAALKPVKKLLDGQFVIEKGNLRYNLQGQEL